MFTPEPTALPALAALAVGAAAFVTVLLIARGRRAPGETGATRDGKSLAGIAMQGLGFALTGMGGQRIRLDPFSIAALGQTALVAALAAGAVGLFAWATRTMGANWSLVARTRSDHALVDTGPFRHVRHPIYVAMFLFLLATAVALGHMSRLILAVPVFALGTALRVRSEEHLLRTKFGTDHDRYAARVKRFVPGVF